MTIKKQMFKEAEERRKEMKENSKNEITLGDLFRFFGLATDDDEEEKEELNEYNVVLTFHMSNIKAHDEDDAYDIARELIEDGDGIEDIDAVITLA